MGNTLDRSPSTWAVWTTWSSLSFGSGITSVRTTFVHAFSNLVSFLQRSWHMLSKLHPIIRRTTQTLEAAWHVHAQRQPYMVPFSQILYKQYTACPAPYIIYSKLCSCITQYMDTRKPRCSMLSAAIFHKQHCKQIRATHVLYGG